MSVLTCHGSSPLISPALFGSNLLFGSGRNVLGRLKWANLCSILILQKELHLTFFTMWWKQRGKPIKSAEGSALRSAKSLTETPAHTLSSCSLCCLCHSKPTATGVTLRSWPERLTQQQGKGENVSCHTCSLTKQKVH